MTINHTWSTPEKWIGIRWEEATSRSHLGRSVWKPEWRGGRNASVRAWREHKSRKHAISALNHGSMQSMHDGKHKSRKHAIAASGGFRDQRPGYLQSYGYNLVRWEARIGFRFLAAPERKTTHAMMQCGENPEPAHRQYSALWCASVLDMGSYINANATCSGSSLSTLFQNEYLWLN
jgi:hypothetical protein